MIEWGPFGEKTQRKNKPGIDFKSIPGSFMAKVHEVDTIRHDEMLQHLTQSLSAYYIFRGGQQ